MSEPAWRDAESADTFTQTGPFEGAAPSGRTIVRVLADEKTLVIGIVCEDPAPDRIVSFSVRRDADLDSEDHVRIVLGPFLDGRSGYVFAVNPSGARYDGLIEPGGEEDNPDWDGIWEAATSRLPEGWSAELRIPIQSAGLQGGTRGLAFQRGAPHPAAAGDGSLGVCRTPVSGHADEPRRSAHGAARVRCRSWLEHPAGCHYGRWRSGTVREC